MKIPREVKYSSRTLDIDILYYDDIIDKNLNVPRNELQSLILF